VIDMNAVGFVNLDETSPDVRRLRTGAGPTIGITDRPHEVAGEVLDALTFTVSGAPSPDRRVVTCDVAQAVELCERAGADNPLACTVLNQTLRIVAQLPVLDALRVESLAYSTLLAGGEFAAWLERRGPRELPRVPEDCVLIERTGELLQLTLNHPSRRNAYSARMRDALVEALQIAVLDPSVAGVQIRGNGPAFCSGGDLAEFGTGPDPVRTHLIRTGQSVGALLAGMADRVEVFVHGQCIGAGIELPSFAGRVTAAPDTLMRLPEIAMGLIPGAGGTVSITRRIGRWRAAWMALTGRPVDGAQALQWGLVDR